MCNDCTNCTGCAPGTLPPLAGTPDLTDYDVILINSSGGKDSTAITHMVVALAKQQGVFDRVVIGHADLGRIEWGGCAELVAEHAAALGVPFEVSIRRTKDGDEPDLLEDIRRRGKFPDAARRWCTSDFKRGPMRRVMTKLCKAVRDRTGRPARLLNVMGMRAEESPKRRDMAAFTRNTDATGKGRAKIVDDWLPIHDWLVGSVWAACKESGLRRHEAYDLGMPRLSCTFCVLANKAALILAAQLRPGLAAEYAAVEAEIDHKSKQGMPMSRIIEMAAETAPVTAVADWAA